jgi:formylmethanofuran dehydrogenase subunit E
MKKNFLCIIICILGIGTVAVMAHDHDDDHNRKSDQAVRSEGGKNPWNQGQPPKDWWAATEQMHGHVGPWNVLGWRIGQDALHEFDTKWGKHDLDIICYIPMEIPYSCMADGLVIGTGNSIGRLDIRLAEVMSRDLIRIAVQRKDGTGPILIFKPKSEYLKKIETRPVEELEKLSKECITMKENELFSIERK